MLNQYKRKLIRKLNRKVLYITSRAPCMELIVSNSTKPKQNPCCRSSGITISITEIIV
jgi:hypothetical protein